MTFENILESSFVNTGPKFVSTHLWHLNEILYLVLVVSFNLGF